MVDAMDAAWASSNAVALQTAVETLPPLVLEGAGSNRFAAPAGALNETASVVPPAPLDLRASDELRFWIHGSRRANGSPAAPFYLEFSYTDAGDLPGELHRWFVPLNEAGKWEHRRIGIENDRRAAITQLQFRCLTNDSFTCRIDELLAVREELLADVESALTARIEGVAVPGLTGLPLTMPSNGTNQVRIPLTPAFESGNQVTVAGGTLGDEVRDVASVTHTALTTQLTLGVALLGNFPAATSTVSLRVPVIVDAGGGPVPTTPNPSLVLTPLDAREDLDRTGYVTQRDSFRLRGALTVCSVRPAARAYAVDYQIVARARTRAQQMLIQTVLLQRLSIDIPLRINGVASPVSILPPPAIEDREVGVLAPVYVRIGTRMETAPRVEQPWVRRAEARSSPKDAPLDQEGIVIQL